MNKREDVYFWAITEQTGKIKYFRLNNQKILCVLIHRFFKIQENRTSVFQLNKNYETIIFFRIHFGTAS